MINQATITERQSLLDIALQHSGSMETAFEIALLNELSLTDDLAAGTQVVLPENDGNKEVENYYAVNDLRPASAITQAEINDTLNIGEGVEFWAIEYDFEVL